MEKILEFENISENIVPQIDPTLYKKDDIPSLTAAIFVYLRAFSKYPFNETWTSTDPSFSFEDDSQLFELIEEILSNPTDVNIHGTINTQTMTYNGREYLTQYPISSITNAYSNALDNPEATLIVKSGGKNFNLSIGERLTKEETVNASAVARLVNYSPDKCSVSNSILKEVGAYLQEDEKEILTSNVSELQTVYLGEIANIKSNENKTTPFTLEAFGQYLMQFGNNLPNQIVYLTKLGTSIENKHRNNASFLKPLLRFVFPRHEIEETVLKFDQEKTLIYIFKILSESTN